MVIAYFGIPSLRQDVMVEAPIKVEIVNVADVTNAPSKQIENRLRNHKLVIVPKVQG